MCAIFYVRRFKKARQANETLVVQLYKFTMQPCSAALADDKSENDVDWLAVARTPMQGPDALTKAGITCSYNPALEAANKLHQYQFAPKDDLKK